MAEYIDREALITKFKQMELGEHSLVERLFADGVYAVIASFPASGVAPVVHGEWILGHVEPGYFTPGGNRPWICSKCKQVVSWSLARPEYNYCPNCGAKMDKCDEPEN